jgi:hypothetical protein
MLDGCWLRIVRLIWRLLRLLLQGSAKGWMMMRSGVLAVLAVSAALAAVAATTSQAAAAETCSFPALSQPFTPWADGSNYFNAPGGDFESGLTGWIASGGAGVVSGNESYNVNGGGAHSLALPTTAASVTTPVMCVTSNAPTFRLFIKNNGNFGMIDGQLAVYLNFQGADGKTQQVKIAALTVKNTNWTLSPKISFIQYISTPLKTGYANISFTFKPNDNHGNWQLDDINIDPYASK